MLADNAVTPVDRDTALARFPVPALAPLLSIAFAIGQPLLASLVGITRWGESESAWGLGLTLVVWYTATAVAAGVMIARHVVGHPLRAEPHEYVTAVVPAALGALLATPVVVVLAHPAEVKGIAYPGISAGLSVPIGAAIGVAVAAAALASAAVLRGLIGSALWVWGAGLLAALVVLGTEHPGTQPPGALAVGLGGGSVAKDLLRDAGLLLAVAGPALIAAWVTVRSLQRGASALLAVAGAVAGSLLIVAVYRTHPSVLVGDARFWYGFALVQFAAAVLAAVGAVILHARTPASTARAEPPL